MKVKVKIKSEQIFEDRRDSEEHECDGEIEYLKNGAILTFVEKFEQQELNFKMTILDNKMIIDRQNETMTLDYERDDNCKIDTPYGRINMTVHTEEMTIKKQCESIEKILLRYLITLENNMQYENIVTINIK